MKWYSWSFWGSGEKIRNVFYNFGYDVLSVRNYLKKEFGYKNGSEIIEDLGVKRSFLDYQLVFKESEIPELNRRLSILLELVKATPRKDAYWLKSSYAFDHTIFPGQYHIKYTVARFGIKYRFREIIEEILKLDTVI